MKETTTILGSGLMLVGLFESFDPYSHLLFLFNSFTIDETVIGIVVLAIGMFVID